MKQCIVVEIDDSECHDFTLVEIMDAVVSNKINLKGKPAFVVFHSLDYLSNLLSVVKVKITP